MKNVYSNQHHAFLCCMNILNTQKGQSCRIWNFGGISSTLYNGPRLICPEKCLYIMVLIGTA